MKIGVISDTHGHLDPRVLDVFAGVDHILHAGDFCGREIILELETVARVTAVLGNMDDDPAFRPTEIATIGGFKFLVHHIVTPGEFSQAIHRRIAQEEPDAVVFGHTHQPYARRFGRTLFLNPGSATQPRGGTARGVALVHLEKDGLRHEFIPL